jgi:hypothetical protein
VNSRGLVLPVDGRRMISTGVGITLVAAGAILRFAVPATFTHGLNVHVAGVIVILAGVFGLLLSLLVWGPLDRRRKHHGGDGHGAPPPSGGAVSKGSPSPSSAQRDAESVRPP